MIIDWSMTSDVMFKSESKVTKIRLQTSNEAGYGVWHIQGKNICLYHEQKHIPEILAKGTDLDQVNDL